MKAIKECFIILIISNFLLRYLICSCTLINIDYYFHYTTHKAEIYIGELTKKYFVIIDLTSQYTWINAIDSSNPLDETDNKLSESRVIYNYNEFKAKQVQDIFGFKNYEGLLKQFDYFFITQNILSKGESLLPQANGVIGLAYSFPDEKYSLIHSLKKEGIIDHMSFSIAKSNQIALGGVPSEISVNNYQSTCEVINGNSNLTSAAIHEYSNINEGHWRCSLSKVIIKNNTKTWTYRTKNDNTVSFIIDKDKNYAPKSFMSFIKDNFYSEELRSKYFRIYNIEGIEQLSSPDDGTARHGNLTFVIGKYQYTIDLFYFWECYDIACDFTIYENPFGDFWILGALFLNQFIMEFDYELKKVVFYSKKEIELYEDIEEYYHIKAMLIVNGVILSIGVFQLFYWRKSK